MISYTRIGFAVCFQNKTAIPISRPIGLLNYVDEFNKKSCQNLQNWAKHVSVLNNK